MDQEQNLQQPTEEGPAEAGSLDAAALAFEQRTQQPTAEEKADEPQADESDEAEEADPDAEAEEGEPDEDTEQAEAVTLTFEGKEFSVPAELAPELEKALLRQSDYSRKMNAVAEKEKATTQKLELAENLVGGAEKLAQVMSQAHVLDAQLKAAEQINWQQLRAENPAEFAARAQELQLLKMARMDAAQRAQAVNAEISQGKEAALQAARAEMFAELSKGLKGWGAEMGEKLTAYAEQSGVKRETLLSLTDPAIVKALDKAAKYDALQAAKVDLKAKAKAAPPVLKPGNTRKASPQDDAMANLRKFKTQDAAEAAFLSRFK